MAGELSGTKIHLRMLIGTVWVFLGGQKTHTETLNNTPIDITSKSSNGFRQLLAGESLQSNDISCEFVFSSDEAFEALNLASQDQSIQQFQVHDAGKNSEGSFKVASVARTSPDNDAITANISLQSTSAFTRDVPVVGLEPVSSFTFIPTVLSVAFTDTSSDPDGTIAAWFWDFGDDNVSSVQSPTNVYALAGTYVVKLTVSDNAGNSSESIQEITI